MTGHIHFADVTGRDVRLRNYFMTIGCMNHGAAIERIRKALESQRQNTKQ